MLNKKRSVIDTLKPVVELESVLGQDRIQTLLTRDRSHINMDKVAE